MAPFTPNGNPQRRNLYGDGNDSYGERRSNTYFDSKGSYGGGGADTTYIKGTAKYGVGDAGKNSYMTGVSKIAPEIPAKKQWTKVFKASFPKGGIMRSSAPSNTDGGTGNGYAERDTSSLYYTGGASYQKGSRSSQASSTPKRKPSYADSIPRPASFSLREMMSMDDGGYETGYAEGGTVGFGIAPPTRPVIPQPGMQPRPDLASMGKGFGQKLGGMFQSIGDRWRERMGNGMGGGMGRPGFMDGRRGYDDDRRMGDDDDDRGRRGGYGRRMDDHSASAPYMSNMRPGQPMAQPGAPTPYPQHNRGYGHHQMQPPAPPAGGYPPPPAGMAPPPMQPPQAAPAGPANNIPPPAFQHRYWGR